MNGDFVARTRERLRAEVLATAEAALQTKGWRGLRMVEIAESVGVSRQTLYNEFLNKTVLARALALKLASEFVDKIIADIDNAPDLFSFWRDAVFYTLERAGSDQRMKAILGADGSDSFLPIFTSEGSPMIALTGGRIGQEVCRRWPDLDPTRVTDAADATARLVISYIVLASEPTEVVADRIADLGVAYVEAAGRHIGPSG